MVMKNLGCPLYTASHVVVAVVVPWIWPASACCKVAFSPKWLCSLSTVQRPAPPSSRPLCFCRSGRTGHAARCPHPSDSASRGCSQLARLPRPCGWLSYTSSALANRIPSARSFPPSPTLPPHTHPLAPFCSAHPLESDTTPTPTTTPRRQPVPGRPPLFTICLSRPPCAGAAAECRFLGTTPGIPSPSIVAGQPHCRSAFRGCFRLISTINTALDPTGPGWDKEGSLKPFIFFF